MEMISIEGYSSYFGGKNGSGVYKTIINQIPKHSVYCELFLGRGTIMRYKKPAPILNIGLDLEIDLCNAWKQAIINLPILIFNQCGIKYLQNMPTNPLFNKVQSSDIFIFLDPPYLIESRKQDQKRYKHELTTAQHTSLLETIVTIPYNIAITCYPNQLYNSYLNRWYSLEFTSQTRKGRVTEILYMNYPHPETLHDYSFIGNNFRERERIRQKIKRHVEGLQRLPNHERNAILEAITKK